MGHGLPPLAFGHTPWCLIAPGYAYAVGETCRHLDSTAVGANQESLRLACTAQLFQISPGNGPIFPTHGRSPTIGPKQHNSNSTTHAQGARRQLTLPMCSLLPGCTYPKGVPTGPTGDTNTGCRLCQSYNTTAVCVGWKIHCTVSCTATACLLVSHVCVPPHYVVSLLHAGASRFLLVDPDHCHMLHVTAAGDQPTAVDLSVRGGNDAASCGWWLADGGGGGGEANQPRLRAKRRSPSAKILVANRRWLKEKDEQMSVGHGLGCSSFGLRSRVADTHLNAGANPRPLHPTPQTSKGPRCTCALMSTRSAPARAPRSSPADTLRRDCEPMPMPMPRGGGHVAFPPSSESGMSASCWNTDGRMILRLGSSPAGAGTRR